MYKTIYDFNVILFLLKGGIIIPRAKNLVGNVYGDFTVIEMLYGYKIKPEIKKARTYCKCLGIDGKEYIIRADALTSGATLHIKGAMKTGIRKDISGKKFGHLTAKYPVDERAANGNIVWYCECDCGNNINVRENSLVRGHTRSCGCRHRSKYEEFISNYLTSLNVKFDEQKRFSDCKNSKGSDMLPFDFYIPKYNTLIEYDGLHHFDPINGWGGEEKFKLTQENDGIKNNYCKENNITLLRIPYTDSYDEIIRTINCFISPVTITA